MLKIYKHIIKSISKGEKLFAVLIDPENVDINTIPLFVSSLNKSLATHIFVGGSTVEPEATDRLVIEIKKYTNLPVVLFPGDTNQLSDNADAILLLSLLSGRNPDYIIGKHIQAAQKLIESKLEIIPTGYLLIESGNETAVERVTKTKPLSRQNIQLIVDTAIAGELLGMKSIYLEAGSGAITPVSSKIISAVKEKISIPLIVGGGIKNKQQLFDAYSAGANIVVIGNAFEIPNTFLDELNKLHCESDS